MNTLAKYTALSLLLHVALGAFLLVGISLPSRNLDNDPGIGTPAEIPIQAVSLDEQEVERQLDRLRQAEAQERAAEQARQQRIEAQQREAREAAEREQQRREEAERQRQQEERRLEELREQQRQEEARLRELQEQERERQAELERQERERQEEERRRQEEEERQRAEEEQRRQEEAERQRREEEQRRVEEERRRQEAEEAERQRRMEEEVFQRRLEQAQTTYGAAIIRSVSEAWSRPPGSPTGLSARINIRLAPDGSVLAAEVIESSGHAAFDRSAELAVRRASPLSVPSDPEIFSRFRDINFTFRPDEQ